MAARKAAAPKETWVRNGRMIEVIDGDTVNVSVDLGLDLTSQLNCRLDGLNTPEKNTAPGKKVKAWMEEQFPVGADVVVQTVKNKGNKEAKEKYGRYLAVIYKPGNPVSINEQLIAADMAKPWNGSGKPPV